MSSRLKLLVALSTALVLVSCSSEPPAPSFEEKCSSRDGKVFSDTTSKLVTGVITGTVFTDKGPATGTGVVTTLMTITVKICTANGETIDMEVGQ